MNKNSTVYTPSEISRYLFDVLSPVVPVSAGTIFDPCVGKGSLLNPFKKNGYDVHAMDIEDQGFPETIVRDFLSMKEGDMPKPSLVLANPPFNTDDRKPVDARHLGFGSRPLIPEVWLRKTISLWGTDQPMVLFSPHTLRLNITRKSRRWTRFLDGTYPDISSIVALPINTFGGRFHSEILMFNIEGVKPHYFYSGREPGTKNIDLMRFVP